MSTVEENGEQPVSSAAQPIPKQPALSFKLEYGSPHCASFISQRSSSVEMYDSDSPTQGLEGQSQTRPEDGAASAGQGASKETGPNEIPADNQQNGLDSEPWMYKDDSLPSSMLHPDHQSTPLRGSSNLTPVSEDRGEGASFNLSGDETTQESREKQLIKPGQLHTPIMGFETMEARSRFTVYKILVQKDPFESVPDLEEAEAAGWFVFRRYSDFVHLNERLKIQFPGFRLALPPKRWFRDNFDKDFLEDRVLGLQAFLNNITGHQDICNSDAVRAFFCTDDPPGPHDTLEESRALCETLEESIYTLRQEIQDKDSELALMKEELSLYKSQVELLTTQLRVMNGTLPKGSESCSSNAANNSLAECDHEALLSAETSEAKNETQNQTAEESKEEDANNS